MILSIIIYITVGAIYTYFNIGRCIDELKQEEDSLNYENKTVISFVFFIMCFTYPEDIYYDIKNYLK